MAFVTHCKDCTMCCNSKAFGCDEWFVSCSDEEVNTISIFKGVNSRDYFNIGDGSGLKTNTIKTFNIG